MSPTSTILTPLHEAQIPIKFWRRHSRTAQPRIALGRRPPVYRVVLGEAEQAFFAVLDRFTVHDLAEGNRECPFVILRVFDLSEQVYPGAQRNPRIRHLLRLEGSLAVP